MDGHTILTARRRGVGGAPLRGGGRIGFRATTMTSSSTDLRVGRLRP